MRIHNKKIILFLFMSENDDLCFASDARTHPRDTPFTASVRAKIRDAGAVYSEATRVAKRDPAAVSLLFQSVVLTLAFTASFAILAVLASARVVSLPGITDMGKVFGLLVVILCGVAPFILSAMGISSWFARQLARHWHVTLDRPSAQERAKLALNDPPSLARRDIVHNYTMKWPSAVTQEVLDAVERIEASPGAEKYAALKDTDPEKVFSVAVNVIYNHCLCSQ